MCTGEMLFVRDIRTFHLHSSSRNKHKQSKVRILEIYSNKKEKRGHDLTTNQLATSHVIPNKKTKKILLALKHSCSLERSFDNNKRAAVQYYYDKKKTLTQSRPLIRSCKVASTEINWSRHSQLNVRFFDQVSYWSLKMHFTSRSQSKAQENTSEHRKPIFLEIGNKKSSLVSFYQ